MPAMVAPLPPRVRLAAFVVMFVPVGNCRRGAVLGAPGAAGQRAAGKLADAQRGD